MITKNVQLFADRVFCKSTTPNTVQFQHSPPLRHLSFDGDLDGALVHTALPEEARFALFATASNINRGNHDKKLVSMLSMLRPIQMMAPTIDNRKFWTKKFALEEGESPVMKQGVLLTHIQECNGKSLRMSILWQSNKVEHPVMLDWIPADGLDFNFEPTDAFNAVTAATAILEVLESYGINPKDIRALMADHASVNKKIAQQLKVRFIGCMSHSINVMLAAMYKACPGVITLLKSFSGLLHCGSQFVKEKIGGFINLAQLRYFENRFGAQQSMVAYLLTDSDVSAQVLPMITQGLINEASECADTVREIDAKLAGSCMLKRGENLDSLRSTRAEVRHRLEGLARRINCLTGYVVEALIEALDKDIGLTQVPVIDIGPVVLTNLEVLFEAIKRLPPIGHTDPETNLSSDVCVNTIRTCLSDPLDFDEFRLQLMALDHFGSDMLQIIDEQRKTYSSAAAHDPWIVRVKQFMRDNPPLGFAVEPGPHVAEQMPASPFARAFIQVSVEFSLSFAVFEAPAPVEQLHANFQLHYSDDVLVYDTDVVTDPSPQDGRKRKRRSTTGSENWDVSPSLVQVADSLFAKVIYVVVRAFPRVVA